jgi:2-polyprenyl-3-methyl-5-hydroxy-6-metoxy-1,4-benzoquinol methylase
VGPRARIRDRLRRSARRRHPGDPAALAASELFQSWWYYSVELLPGVATTGIYVPDLPMLPRLMLRRCALDGTDCLDLGCMEGLISVLMCRGGARQVLGVDAVDHCLEKLDAVRHYHGADFEYRSIGLMYELAKKLPRRGYDVINCSGLLYHVFSPLLVLCGVRPLLKRGGLMVVSTNVTLEERYAMQFNDAGRMQTEVNTFWYFSVPLFDYLLRYLRLAPLDCAFLPHTAVRSGAGYVFDRPSGYLSVLCRAVDDPLPARGDEWMAESVAGSWEYRGLVDWKRAARQPVATTGLRAEPDRRSFRPEIDCLDLWQAVQEREPLGKASDPSDTHLLRLSDRT